jgi:hypothetical protein
MPESKNKDQQITHALNLLFENSKKDSKLEREEWDEGLKEYKGEQKNRFAGKGRKSRRTNSITNFLFAEMETIKPILTANIPKITLRPVRESDAWQDIAKLWGQAIALAFSRNDIGMRVLELVDNGLFFGKGYFKPTFDDGMMGGFGDIKIEVPNTKRIYLEPGIERIRDANYIFEVREVNRLSLMRQYPEKVDEIMALFRSGGAGVSSMPGMQAGLEDSKQISPSAPGAAANTGSTTIFDVMAEQGNDKAQKGVNLIEAWFHDPEMVEVSVDVMTSKGDKQIDGRTGKPKTEKRMSKRFPNGRLVQFAEKVKFGDQPNKFPGIPYIEYWNYVSPDTPYGTSELKNTRQIQKQINVRKNQLSDLLNLNLAPTRIVGIGADMKTPWTNEPGQIVRVNDVNQVKVIPAPNVSLAAFTSTDQLKQDLETVFGVREVTQGTIPGDIRSGAAIEALQEAADVRLRGKTRQIEIAIKNLSRFILNMMVAHYKEGVHYFVDEKLKKTPEWKQTVGKGVRNFSDFFDIEVQAGVNLPRSRIAKQQLILELHARGLLSDSYVASHVDLDDFDALELEMGETWNARRDAQLAEVTQGGQQDAANINAV